MGLKLRSVAVSLPFGLGGVQVDVSEAEVRAAWNLYVEFATRITGVPLARSGSAREALNSLYTLFDTTRDVLKTAGPEIADGPDSLGPLAVRILNEGLRPFIVKWHARLRAFERARGDGDDESAWAERPQFDAELERVRDQLARYLDLLADIAGVSR
jgi:hypothetical protein